MMQRSRWPAFLTTCFALLIVTTVLHAQTPAAPQTAPIPQTTPAPPASTAGQTVLLWADKVPEAIGTDDADKPTITIYQPEAAKRVPTAVLVCPGGGYGALAMDHEGKQIADWLNARGVTAAVLKYRIAPRYHFPAPLLDAQRGIRYLRTHATDLGFAPDRIGIWGFSAGGHLASTVGTHFDAGDPKATDIIDRASSRPDFMILAYPVITMTESYMHTGSRNNLIGEKPKKKLAQSLSNERQVTAQTPPTFLFHTTDDPVVPVENSIAFYQALVKAKVPSEFHAYQHGPHGVGLAPNDPVLATWADRLSDWLRIRGLLSVPPANVAGTWVITGDISGNPVNATATFKQDGTTLNGTAKAQGITDAPVTGEVTGNKVVLRVKVNYQGSDVTLVFTGTVAPDGTIAGTIDAMGFPGNFTAKRQ